MRALRSWTTGHGRRVVPLVAASGLAVMLLLAACGASPPSSGRAEVGRAVPSFELASLSGESLGPGGFVGKVVVVDFWATWCAPCRIQHQILDAIHDQYEPEDVQFLAINSGEPEELVRAFHERSPFSYPVLLDADERVSMQLGLVGLPTLMIVDREGSVTYFQAGLLSKQQVADRLAEAGA